MDGDQQSYYNSLWGAHELKVSFKSNSNISKRVNMLWTLEEKSEIIKTAFVWEHLYHILWQWLNGCRDFSLQIKKCHPPDALNKSQDITEVIETCPLWTKCVCTKLNCNLSKRCEGDSHRTKAVHVHWLAYNSLITVLRQPPWLKMIHHHLFQKDSFRLSWVTQSHRCSLNRPDNIIKMLHAAAISFISI